MRTVVKVRKCKICKNQFMPSYSTLQATCNEVKCILQNTRNIRSKEAATKLKTQRKADRKWKKDNKTRSKWIKEAQSAFNKFIRLRDIRDFGTCISSGKPLGQKFDAGHYLSTKAHPELRFNELNCHGQSVHDNQHLSGNSIDYRAGLINRFGVHVVDYLEGPHDLKQYRIDDIKIIIKWYKRKVRRLENGNI